MLALLLAGCGSSAPSIHIDLTRAYPAESISIYFCPPQLASMQYPNDRCTYAGNPFLVGSDLSTTADIDVPSGHSPVPLALVGDLVSSKACHAVSVNLQLPTGQVSFSAVESETAFAIGCDGTVCASDSTDCSFYGLP